MGTQCYKEVLCTWEEGKWCNCDLEVSNLK